MAFEEILRQTRSLLCLDCGKCTGTCPVTRVDPTYSPRATIERVLAGRPEELINNDHLWACLTCRLCTTRCPSGVDYPAFVVAARVQARGTGVEGTYAHNAVMQELMGLMTLPVKQNRTGWVSGQMRTAAQGEDFYFVGCLPYFDVIFADLGVVSTEVARNTVRLLNRLGITPVVSDDERCCGSDLLLNGDEVGFRRLAELNVRTIAESGAKRVIFSCPECYNAFRNDYPRVIGPLPFEVVHLTELLAEHVGELGLGGLEETVTYHDPCRLGRYQGIYEEPRALIQAIPGLELVEMRKNRAQGLCCGTTGWVNCGQCAKGIQITRLRQAQATGATRMITACPKCRIHFTCALNDVGEEIPIEVEDLTGLLARSMEE
ncbi:MAG TPA: (Fe-S)-binding protein [Anaerolineales bacterium]|nr:(Fe-S)-binding protein [Anaerolineae bacterium]HIQ02744.1 (Fe-S)-binding protein [Anaerolineales bacterium]